MITVKVSEQPFLDIKADAYVALVEQDFDPAQLEPIAQKLFSPLGQAIKERSFFGHAGSSLILTGTNGDRGVYIILLGVGAVKGKHIPIETYRRALGRLVRIVETHKLNNVSLTLPDPTRLGLSHRVLAQEIATIVHKAAYHFDTFITEPERRLHWEFELILSAPKEYIADVQEGINQGITIGNAINNARYWCDMPPSVLTPSVLANNAKEIADKYGLKATIFDEQEIIEMGMGGLYAVSRGSTQECRLAILEYTASKDAPTVAIVGKGITFDSGGLSIKPAVSMETMKDDMAGAAVVIATMQIIAQMKPSINVVALAPMSENMTGGSAGKPGDIVKFYNGKTAEVKNTDAEGRLVLADAMSYAVKHYKPAAIIDVATLTGSCASALGPFYAGLFSVHEDLVKKIYRASDHSGDRVWRFPMDDDYKAAINSDVADMCNIGNPKYMAGAITAAFFLKNFVGDTPWAHLDIAGTAFGVPDRSYLRPGATGFGIRLLVDLIKHWQEEPVIQ